MIPEVLLTHTQGGYEFRLVGFWIMEESGRRAAVQSIQVRNNAGDWEDIDSYL